MDDITLNILVLLVFALIGGLIFYIVHRNQARNEQEIIRLAAEKGWKVENIREPLAWGLRLSAPAWTLESISRSSGRETGPGSSDVAMSTVWRAEAPGPILLIGPRTSQANLGAMGDMLTRQSLQAALGADADGLGEVQAGSNAFRQKYMLWARSQAEIRLDPALESALLRWKDPLPLIQRTSQGVSVELRGIRLTKPADFLALVQLGELFL